MEKKKKRSNHVMNWRNRKKIQLVEYKGGKCEKCGYDKPIYSVYEFHHLDPTQKDFSISGKSWSFERLKAEVDKCIMLCANCHAEEHFNLDQVARVKRLAMKILERKPFEWKDCLRCGEAFLETKRGQKFCCKSCCTMHNRKVERPPIEVLLKELETSTFVSLGEKYGVTDNAIRKWLGTALLKKIRE